MKKGFTLVELSVVLVIVGLLIGGILVAQSMLGTSRIQAMTRQIGQFDAAMANFQTKFNQMPGDSNLLGAALGNNNKAVEHGGGCGYYSGEIAKFWSDLSASGVVNALGLGAFVDTSASGESLTINPATKMPLALAGTKAYFMVYGTALGTNYYMITNPTAGSSVAQIATANAFNPTDALAVDQKLDDGKANSGAVVGSNLAPAVPGCAGIFFSAPASNTPCATAAAGDTYNVSTKTDSCSLAVRIGSVTGDTK